MAEKSVKMIFADHSVNRKVVDNVENYLNMQFQPKLMQRSQENGQKPDYFEKFLIKKILDFSAKIGLPHFSTFTTG